ncbi:MAG: c-type cytochrome [Dehalococcoidia bacterium]|jgi:mono/diheme cytochrome c family protein|nr:c-type cytochrome [Dehalococcoidia bacterium]
MISTRLISLTGLMILGAIFVAACGGEEAEVVPTPVFEPTAASAGEAPSADTSAPADSPEPTQVPAALVGDATNGEALFTGASGCSGCHATGSTGGVGPGLSGIGTTAGSRVDGQSADEYLNTAIVSPNDFVVPDFAPIMPVTFGEKLSEQEIADVIAYLVALP